MGVTQLEPISGGWPCLLLAHHHIYSWVYKTVACLMNYVHWHPWWDKQHWLALKTRMKTCTAQYQQPSDLFSTTSFNMSLWTPLRSCYANKVVILINFLYQRPPWTPNSWTGIWLCTQHCGCWYRGAKAWGHWYPQCWWNIHSIQPVSYQIITFIVSKIGKWKLHFEQKIIQLF